MGFCTWQIHLWLRAQTSFGGVEGLYNWKFTSLSGDYVILRHSYAYLGRVKVVIDYARLALCPYTQLSACSYSIEFLLLIDGQLNKSWPWLLRSCGHAWVTNRLEVYFRAIVSKPYMKATFFGKFISWVTTFYTWILTIIFVSRAKSIGIEGFGQKNYVWLNSWDVHIKSKDWKISVLITSLSKH